MDTDLTLLRDDLHAVLGSRGLLDPEDFAGRSCDPFRHEAIASPFMARPASATELSEVVKVAARYGLKIVTHGGLTGLAGGAFAASDTLVVSTERMRQIEEINEVGQFAVVGAGVSVEELQNAVETKGLFYPIDLGSKGSATIGGTISTNAGGNHVIRWGMTRQSVLGIEAVLADGTIVNAMAIATAALPDAFGKTGTKEVYIGSDVELAQRVREDLTERLGRVVHAEGAFWHYERTHWKPVLDRLLRVTVHSYDGAEYETPSGEPSRVKLGKGRIDSILNECATLCSEPEFFAARPIGINCASGFIRFDEQGVPTLVPHDSAMRCRHTLPGQWQAGNQSEPPEGSLLAKLLGGAFLGDPEANDKVTLLAEVCGAAALGYATHLIQPKAVILYGQTAENGKSQILDLARGLLPANAICSVPAARMGDERHVIGLVGKLLNATDELSSAAVASDTFKSIVTGEPIEGRDVYKSRIEFRSIAQNLFATNNLPAFQGGIDRGVQRRLLVIPFNRTIPKEERIENIGQRIAREEADLLLAWVVAGAARLVAHRNFTIPPSCAQALTEWIFGADPVLAWLDECTEVFPFVPGSPYLTTRSAYASFQNWATTEGFKGDKLPAINGFVQRIQANVSGISYKRTSVGRVFMGLRIKTAHGA